MRTLVNEFRMDIMGYLKRPILVYAYFVFTNDVERKCCCKHLTGVLEANGVQVLGRR